MSVLGLDISTSYTGVAILEPDDLKIIRLDHIHFKKCKTVWEKADRAAAYIDAITDDIDAIYIEDPAKKFSTGTSSAGTIVTLARFNGLLSYMARNKFGLDPEYLSPGQARKLCGLKMQQKKKCGMTHKEQTFQAIMKTDLSHITWPNKLRSTNIVDYAYDIVDAYVICKAGINLNHKK